MLPLASHVQGICDSLARLSVHVLLARSAHSGPDCGLFSSERGMPVNPLSKFLEDAAKKAVILDGGFGTELERIGKDYQNDPLWSAKILAEDPSAVKQVHRSFFDAGADVGITCSYQATQAGFQKAGYTKDESDELFRRSIQLASAARDEFWEHHLEEPAVAAGRGGGQQHWRRRRQRPIVAFSCGPYAACLADGSEYTGAYVDSVPFEQLVDFHRKKLQVVKSEDFDVIAFETLASVKEAKAIMYLLHTESINKPAWLTFSCKDEVHTSHGEVFAEELAPLALQSRELIGIGVNCTPPRFVPNLISSAAEVFKGVKSAPLLIAYPNSGEGWINKTGKWDGDSDLQGKDLGAVGLSWLECGAQIIGGCCRTTPEYITSLAEALS